MAEPAAPPEGTPAEPVEAQVQIELGPHDIYPESPAAPEPPSEPADDDEAPEPEGEAAPPTQPSDAGVRTDSPQQGETQPKRSRRERGEEAYQRGLSEGRAAAQQDLQRQQQQQLFQQAQQQAGEQIQQLFQQLSAPTFQAREEAGKKLAAIHQQTLQGNQALELARQQVHQQMAADFATVKDLDGATEDDLRDLFNSASMSDFARKVHTIGRRGEQQLQARITKLEAELQAARAHAVGARATPEAANGNGRIGSVSMHDLQSLSLKEIRKLEGTPEYDRMVAQHLADLAAGRIT